MTDPKHPLTDDPIRVGDYVHAAVWSDFDPNDPWCIGFVNHITMYGFGTRYFIRDEDGNLLGGGRGFEHVKRITSEEGAVFIEKSTHTPIIEKEKS